MPAYAYTTCAVCREFLADPVARAEARARVTEESLVMDGIPDSCRGEVAGHAPGLPVAENSLVMPRNPEEKMGRGGLYAAELAISSTSGLISRNGKVQHGAKLRAPMSPMRFRAVLEMLAPWTQARLAAELRVSSKSVNNWVKGRCVVPRTVELAMLFLLIREKPTEMAANSAELERIP